MVILGRGVSRMGLKTKPVHSPLPGSIAPYMAAFLCRLVRDASSAVLWRDEGLKVGARGFHVGKRAAAEA